MDAINQAMFEFAMTVQCLVKLGYEFVEVKDGERRLGIPPSLILRKDGEEIKCYNPDELDVHLRKYWDNKESLY